MRELFLFHFFLWVTGFSVATAQQGPAIIPEPVEIKKGNGIFSLDSQTAIIVPSDDQELMQLAQSLANWLAPATGYTLKINNRIRSSSKQIRLSIDPASAKRNAAGQLFANLSTDIDGLTIYYTLDNTNPDAFSNKYNGTAVEIPKGIYQLRTIAYQGNVPAGKVLVISRDELEVRAKK